MRGQLHCASGRLGEHAFDGGLYLEGELCMVELRVAQRAQKQAFEQGCQHLDHTGDARLVVLVSGALTDDADRLPQALAAGGVGVANAVRAYLDAKRSVIATFKCLGAPASLVALVYLLLETRIAANSLRLPQELLELERKDI